MRILHLASFNGNIGDMANHAGFYKNFEKHMRCKLQITQCEIRNFYRSWNLRHFDEDFAQEVNAHDILVIGGGNFFETCWDYSSTGTTIDISEEILSQIQKPIFINGIGFDDTKGHSKESIARFQSFILRLLQRKNTVISLRNDGSSQLMAPYFPAEVMNRILTVPDGGFFFEPKPVIRINRDGKPYIGICLAKDMLQARYKTEQSYSAFIEKIAVFCNDVLGRDQMNIVFVPHIFSDQEIIFDVVSRIEDQYRRQRVLIGPILTSRTDAANACFGLYSQCEVVLSMRFHGNVVPIGNNIPTIGLISLRKHGLLYDEIGLPQRRIDIRDPDFLPRLRTLYHDTIMNLSEIKSAYGDVNQKMEREIQTAYAEAKEILDMR